MNLTKEKKKLILRYIMIIALITFFIGTVSKSYAYSAIVGSMKPTPQPDQKLTSIGNQILGIIQFIGVAVLLGSIIVLGIVAVSNSDSKKMADLKDGLILIVIGAFLILAPVSVVKMIYNSADNGAGGSSYSTPSAPRGQMYHSEY